ncbi:unnamed protein product [Macrosiphum euphorbiae]|uniref:Uncharacterized protein n=1 Tax=Macrosiphum euphorbiae TaxID=13131 RepID=A0AAV0W7U1_9HEMI|nr:unnamed protein product [Macrosiphum euphorbiae]
MLDTFFFPALEEYDTDENTLFQQDSASRDTGYLKAKVFENNPPRNIVDLKERIRLEINNITLETLHNVMGSFAVRLSQCVANQGRYLPDTIFKK